METEMLKRIQSTDIFCRLRIVSKIATELISAINCFSTTSDVWAYRKLIDEQIYLIVNSKGPGKPLLYAIAWRSNIYNEVHECPGEKGEWSFTDFRTIHPFMLNSWVNLDLVIASHTIALVEKTDLSIEFFTAGVGVTPEIRWVRRMINWMTMISLEAKEHTLNAILQSRYGLMEVSRGRIDVDLLRLNGFKNLTKFPDEIRSPVLCWFMQQYIHLMGVMMEEPPKMLSPGTKTGVSHDLFEGLWDPFTGMKVPKFELVMVGFYSSHVCAPLPEMNSYKGAKSIVQKIIKEELSLWRSFEKNGFQKLREYNEDLDHSFSQRDVIVATDHWISVMTKLHGRNFLTMAEKRIEEDLAAVTLKELSTKKSSANGLPWHDMSERGTKSNTTSENILELMSERPETDPNPMCEIDVYIAMLEDGQGGLVKMFKKLQKGWSQRDFYSRDCLPHRAEVY